MKWSRYHCGCCFCVVCSVCSGFRLPGLRELRVCSVCYRDNMLRWEDVLHRGIHTETVAFSTSGEVDTWEVVELDRSLVASSLASASQVQIALRPAPYTVLTGVLLSRRQSLLFGTWKVRVSCSAGVKPCRELSCSGIRSLHAIATSFSLTSRLCWRSHHLIFHAILARLVD